MKAHQLEVDVLGPRGRRIERRRNRERQGDAQPDPLAIQMSSAKRAFERILPFEPIVPPWSCRSSPKVSAPNPIGLLNRVPPGRARRSSPSLP